MRRRPDGVHRRLQIQVVLPAGQSTAPGSRMTWLTAAGRSRQQILSFMQYPVEICLNSLKI